MKKRKTEKKEEKTMIIRMIQQKNKPMMGKIGVDRSDELKITEEETI